MDENRWQCTENLITLKARRSQRIFWTNILAESKVKTMALIITGQSKCAICGEVIQKSELLVTTSPFIKDKSHPLWRYSDAAMHRPCFLAWSGRLFFIKTFNEFFDSHFRGMRRMLEDGTIEEHDPNTGSV